jgi:hypothetical protein
MSARAWRQVEPGEIFEPGRRFRVNVTTGQTEVREPGDETEKFLAFWRKITSVAHITLVAIIPDGQTTTRTFPLHEPDHVIRWVETVQNNGCNIYFTPNETRVDCDVKPTKDKMVAARCRGGDVDPVDDQFPYAEERERLARLAAHLAASPDAAPTVITDSGNGIQPIWVSEREPLSPPVIIRVEDENKAIEAALGAGGTHNIDRLFRLPGTLNYPNRKKLALGRGISHARLIHCAPNVYTPAQAAELADRLRAGLAGTDLVRAKPAPNGRVNGRATDTATDADTAGLIAELRAAGAENIIRASDLPRELHDRLQVALEARRTLADRWAGMVDDLTERGMDHSRSAADLSLAAMLKAAGFGHRDTGLVLLAYPHGKANGDLRHVARCVLRSHEPAAAPERGPEPPPHPGTHDDKPDEWPEPVDFMAAQLGAPILKERHVPPSLWPFISDNAERMGVATSSVALTAIVSTSAAMNEEWKIQPKRNDWDWTEAARLWGALVGPPSILKSPVIALASRPIEMLDIKAMEEWNAEQAAHAEAHAAWKEAGDETEPEPKMPPRDRYLVESATIEALQEVLRDDAAGKLRAPLGKVLVRQDELEEFLANTDKYSTNGKGNDRGAWLRAYNGGRHSIDRIGRGSFATKSWSCCLIGGIQPDVIREIARRTTDNGMIQRLMLDVPGPQSPGLDRAPDLAARDLYHDLFPVLAALHPGRNANGHIEHVVLHADAHAAREDIEALARVMQVMPDASPRLASTFGKWPGLFARLCLTFHLIEAAAARVRNPAGQYPPLPVVTADTANRVRDYMRAVLMPSLLRAETLMFDTAQTGHATWISQHILIHGLERITARDITRAYGALRAPEERPTLYSVMDSLCLFGWLTPIQRGEAQPVTTWSINPRVHILYAERAETERERRAAVAADIARERAAYHKPSD